MKKFAVTTRGIQPLLMKSARGIDPTDPMVKQIKSFTSKKTKKTDSDLLEIDRLDFLISLYWNGQYVYVPDVNILGSLRDGAKANRRGREVQAGVDVLEIEVPLLYDGPKTPEELYTQKWVDRRSISNAGSGGRVMRTRPRFNQWGLSFTLVIDEHVASPDDMKAALEHAGLRCGIGDYRPRFGRYEVTGWKEVA